MSRSDRLFVYLWDRLVGTLAMGSDGKVAFEYSEEWLEDGFAISPFSLPLEKRVFVPRAECFGGLFGVFADSLPDSWGRLLLDRMLRRNDVDPSELDSLDRLAIVGASGMGALTYRPEYKLQPEKRKYSLDEIATECKKILEAKSVDSLDELYRLGGTSGGARPKIMTAIRGEEWIVKFAASSDMQDMGKMEYDYARCAKKCGIAMSQTRLFSSELCSGYFGTRRYDRVGGRGVHVLTVAAILEIDYTVPSLDYHDLMKLTKILTHDDRRDVEMMFRQMCFNVFAHNRDDHAKNFSFIYDEASDIWHLSPAYDLTYSSTYYGEHTTTVDGSGDPNTQDLLAVGVAVGMKKSECESIMDEIGRCVRRMLGKYI